MTDPTELVARLRAWDISDDDKAKIADLIEALARENAALKAGAVRVKPLVWVRWYASATAEAALGEYVIQDEGESGWGMWTPNHTDGDDAHSFYPTLEAAKAAAQADYEARILSAVETAPADPLADPRVVALREAAAPFMRMSEEMFARNWNRPQVAIALDTITEDKRLTFGDFLDLRTALAALEARE